MVDAVGGAPGVVGRELLPGKFGTTQTPFWQISFTDGQARPACRWIGDNVAALVLNADLQILTAEAAAQEVWVVGADPRDAEGVQR
jgi:hypothetical protein